MPALTFSLPSLSWFFRVIQLEPALICSRKFLLFLHTKEHVNLAESSDIVLQQLDVAVLHHLPWKIVLPHCRWGQQEWGSEQTTVYTCGKYRESNHFIMMGVMWDECHKPVEHQHFQVCLNTWYHAVNNQSFKTKKQLGNDSYIELRVPRLHWVLPEFHEKIMQLLFHMWCSLCFHADLLLFWCLDYRLLVYNMRYCVILKCLDKYRSKCKHSLTEQFYRQKWCDFHLTVCSYIEVLLK